jgi:pimeloyl-ACP methyl ester carboxylesterase
MPSTPITHSATRPGVTIEYALRGGGPPVVLLPSWGRGGEDYDALAEVLADNGYSALQPRPRGVQGSTGPMEGVTLKDLATDVAAVVEHAALGPAVVVGHALGNRIGRMLTAQRPDLVRAVVLLAAGGKFPQTPEGKVAWSAATAQIESGQAVSEDVIHRAYFAREGDPTPWTTGWYAATRIMQNHAVTTAKLEDWWTAGASAPLLVVQGLDDIVAPPENGRSLKTELGDRVQLVELSGAGHAILLEKPLEVAGAILMFLARVAPLP